MMLKFDLFLVWNTNEGKNRKTQTFTLSTIKMKGWRLESKFASIKYVMTLGW